MDEAIGANNVGRAPVVGKQDICRHEPPGLIGPLQRAQRSTKDIIDSAKIARKAGAKVIGILGSANAPLSKQCDVALSVFSREAALRLAPMTSRLVQLAVVDVLFVTVAMKDFSTTKERLDKVKRSLVEKRY